MDIKSSMYLQNSQKYLKYAKREKLIMLLILLKLRYMLCVELCLLEDLQHATHVDTANAEENANGK